MQQQKEKVIYNGATNKLEANLHNLGMRRGKSSYFSKKMLPRACSARCAPLEVTLKETSPEREWSQLQSKLLINGKFLCRSKDQLSIE